VERGGGVEAGGLNRAGVTYVQLAERMKERGFAETRDSHSIKLGPGAFVEFLSSWQLSGINGAELNSL
jgi:hypothetical protein